MTNRDEIIAKIKKCLALGKSSNEHEASAALRQAQKLMEAHGIDERDVADSEIGELLGRSTSGAKPPNYEALLAIRIARAFGCEEIFKAFAGWMFIGAGPSPEIAQYAFDVLYRQVKRARSTYIKTRLQRCGPLNKVRRADLYCDGWVSTATSHLHKLTINPEQQQAIAGYIERRYTIESLSPRERTKRKSLCERDFGDYSAGRSDGRGAELNRGVGGCAPLALE